MRWCAATPTAGLHVLREAATPPSFPSLQSGGNRTERRAAQKLGRAIFTTLCSGSVRGPGPRRPVASSLPQAAEFNPRTALPRGDGKHLASCSGYKASVSHAAPVLLETLKTSQSWTKPHLWCLIVLFLQTELSICLYWTSPVMVKPPWRANDC